MRSHRLQARGGASIEFAILFGVFFMLSYGGIAYSLPLLLQLSYGHLSAAAARTAVRVDPILDRDVYAQTVSTVVTQSITGSWLPDSWLGGDCPIPDDGLHWDPLPGTPSFGHLAREEVTPQRARYVVHVCIQRKYNDAGPTGERAIIPVLRLATMEIPALPVNSQGDRILRGSAIRAL